MFLCVHGVMCTYMCVLDGVCVCTCIVLSDVCVRIYGVVCVYVCVYDVVVCVCIK